METETKKKTTSKNTTKKRTSKKSSSKPSTKKSEKSTKTSNNKKTTNSVVNKPVKKNPSKKKEDTINFELILPTLLFVIIIALLAIGLAFSYFLVSASNDFNTTNVKTEVGDIGSVAFSSGNAHLTLDLSGTQMLQLGEDVAYYASNNGTTTTDTVEEMGRISVTGEGVFDCKYALEIKATAKSADTNMYTKFQNMATKSEDQVVLTLYTQDGMEIYDFNTAGLFTGTNNDTIIYNGEANGLKDGLDEVVKAQLKIVNKTGIVQDDLKGSDISLALSVSTFGCEIVG